MLVRKQIRLTNHDYSLLGNYFMTTCVKNKYCCLGHINQQKMILNKYGKIASEELGWLSEFYNFVKIGKHVIMPNHVHAIIQIHSIPGKPAPRSLSQLISTYKSRVSTRIRKNGMPEFSWQRSYHEHIIRNQISYDNIANYIVSNPKLWLKDCYYI